MSDSTFAYGLRQRVTVPGWVAQGIVLQRRDSVDGQNHYLIRWLDTTGDVLYATFGEDEIVAANPAPAPVAATPAPPKPDIGFAEHVAPVPTRAPRQPSALAAKLARKRQSSKRRKT
jgi:hypothetical protein